MTTSEKQFFVYIMASRKHGTLYIGVTSAIQREKSLKRWPRGWKTNLIERGNPEWRDLYLEKTAGS